MTQPQLCPTCSEHLTAIRDTLVTLNADLNRLRHPRILVGLKEICDYMRTPRSTIQRWRRDQALPVMSTGRRKHGYSVLTSTSLLDSWISAASRAFQKPR